jgi:hypothetical protein
MNRKSTQTFVVCMTTMMMACFTLIVMQLG